MTHTCWNNLVFFLELLVKLNSTSSLTLPSRKSLSALQDSSNSHPLHSLVEYDDSFKTHSTSLQIHWLHQGFAAMACWKMHFVICCCWVVGIIVVASLATNPTLQQCKCNQDKMSWVNWKKKRRKIIVWKEIT
jgi:hypothetical protein